MLALALILIGVFLPLIFLVLLFLLIHRPSTAAAPPSPAADPALQIILDTLPHPVAIFSPDLAIRTANTPAQELFQFAPPAAAGALPHKWLLPLLEECRNSRKRIDPPGYHAAVQIFSNNRELLFLPHAAPLLSPIGAVTGIVLILVDATGMRQVDEAKSGLLSTVSHELKTPLTSLQMAIHLLAEDSSARLPPRHRELLATARDDADRLNTLINDLLDVGRLRSGKAPLQLEPTTPMSLFEAAGESLRREFDEKHLTLQADLPETLPAVRADPARAAYILAALLTAARRAAKPNTAIAASAHLLHPHLALRILVPNDALDPLFADPRSPSGRDGISLAVAHEIAAAHGGQIAFTNEPAGPQWQLTLPLANP
jgi:signal transduction histidine kinase